MRLKHIHAYTCKSYPNFVLSSPGFEIRAQQIDRFWSVKHAMIERTIEKSYHCRCLIQSALLLNKQVKQFLRWQNIRGGVLNQNYMQGTGFSCYSLEDNNCFL